MDWTEKTKKIRLVLTDCDGVLTDSGVYYSETGAVMKRFHIRDGMAVERLRALGGIETGIVTGEQTASVRFRAKKLAIEELHQNAQDKKKVVSELCERRGIELAQIAYIGDDVNDLEVLQMVGLSACPQDAEAEVKKVVDLVLSRRGGQGVFREFAEFILSPERGIQIQKEI